MADDNVENSETSDGLTLEESLLKDSKMADVTGASKEDGNLIEISFARLKTDL